jgi:predicted MFS family arabinose efflux permease
MRIGIAALILSYVLSQFYRAFLAVLAPILAVDLNANAEALAQASGWWFLTFALMQIPVGWALDKIGPRLTTSVLLLVAAAGAAVFASATSALAITLAMVLIGIGCSSVLMSSYYIFARTYAPAVFGTLAGMVVGIGSLGNIGASLPLSWAVDAFGWRGTVWALAAITFAAAVAIFALVRDPAKVEGTAKGSLLDLLKMPALWPILLMMAACYAPPAGIRGLWAGPWYADVFAADAARIGQVTLIMGLAMVAGNFAYGPLDRVLGTRKWLIFGGNALMLACLLGLYTQAGTDSATTIGLVAGVGFFGASFPMVMAHGRAFLPPHLTGRGVSLINLFGIGSAGIMQIITGRIHTALTPSDAVINSAPPAAPYAALFAFYAVLVAVGLMIYLFAKDRTD